MPSEAELRLHRCCFTGHRPEKLHMTEMDIVTALESSICMSITDGYVTFISGMARGTDIWAAEIVLRLKNEGNMVHLICASPYKGFERSWSLEWQRRYNAVIEASDLVRYICPAYSRMCFQIRNEWMINHSARVIAVYNGKPCGTRNTINYARRHNVDVFNVMDCSWR